MKCDRCGKGTLVGMNVSHSHVRTKKRSYPNLHAFTIKTAGVKRRLRLCTKCLRIVKKTATAEARNRTETQKTTIPEEIDSKIESTDSVVARETSEEKIATNEDAGGSEVTKAAKKIKHSRNSRRYKK